MANSVVLNQYTKLAVFGVALAITGWVWSRRKSGPQGTLRRHEGSNAHSSNRTRGFSGRKEVVYLIVGDGNFSFALSLLRLSLEGRGPLVRLVATSYDSDTEVLKKYGTKAIENITQLKALGAIVCHSVDATKLLEQLGSIMHPWGGDSNSHLFDRAIFMNPLIGEIDRPRVKGEAQILVNRHLLVDFLRECAKTVPSNTCMSKDSAVQVLSKEVFIVSKEVYPYLWWRIGSLAKWAPPFTLIKSEVFDANDYPGYTTAVVDRGANFALTGATSFLFAMTSSPRAEDEPEDTTNECRMCNKFFASVHNRDGHFNSGVHRQRARLEERWLREVEQPHRL